MEQNTTNKPLRRVGTLTLGVCLIAAGTLFLLARFLPGLPWLVIWQVIPAAGLILLGCEVLYYSARRMPVRLRLGGALPADDGWVLRRLDLDAGRPDAGQWIYHSPVIQESLCSLPARERVHRLFRLKREAYCTPVSSASLW